MESDNNSLNWFSNDQEIGFSEVYGSINKPNKKNYSKEKENYSNKQNYNNNNKKYYNKNINKDNNDKNDFLNKKRVMPKTEQEYISEIKRLMKEGGLHDKFIFIEKKKKGKKQNNINNNIETTNNSYDNQNQNNNIQNSKETSNINNNTNNISSKNPSLEEQQKINQIKPVKPIQQTKSLKEWYQKLNLLPFNNTTNKIISSSIPYEEEKGTGIVRFNGINNEDNYMKYYIYLREKNDIDLYINEKKRYEWKVSILCDSYLIGIGLADKKIVKKNKNIFLSEDENFYNGVYCMLSTYNKECNIKEIRPWHSDDKNIVNHVANFPQFKKGRTINIIYDNANNTLEFNSKKYSYKMVNVSSKNNYGNENEKKVLSPCVVFYYSGDEVMFTDVNIISC